MQPDEQEVQSITERKAKTEPFLNIMTPYLA
jgi:hypothetical protein